MENLMNNGKFIDLTNLGWTFSFEANGKYPMIANRIFETLEEAEAFIHAPEEIATAVPGLILRVIGDVTKGNNGAYLVERDGEGLKLNPLMTGDIHIELAVVWAVKNDEGKWVECPEGTPGAVRCLKLAHDELVTLIPLTDILILDEYAKIADVDASLAIRDASIDANRQSITDLSIYIDDFVEETHKSIEDINSSMLEAFIHLDNIDSSMVDIYNHLDYVDETLSEHETTLHDHDDNIKQLDKRVDDHGLRLDLHGTWIENASQRLDTAEKKIKSIEASLGEHTVTSITAETESMFVTVSPLEQTVGDVTIGVDVSVCDSYDENTEVEGLTSTKYVEERLFWKEY